MRRRIEGLTLTELLILMVIICILGTILAVNFQGTRDRAKLSKTKNDLHSIAAAIEAYNENYGAYLPPSCSLRYLTTPIAFISPGHLEDPFGNGATKVGCSFQTGNQNIFYYYSTISSYSDSALASLLFPIDTPANFQIIHSIRYVVSGRAPDSVLEVYRNTVTGKELILNVNASQEFFDSAASFTKCHLLGGCIYDPTNGLISRGDIARTGHGEMRGRGHFD